MKRLFAGLTALSLLAVLLTGCGDRSGQLSPRDPVVLSMWHVYGEQADSPMNRLVEEFNETVGRDRGVIINVTLMTNSTAVEQKLLDAQAHVVGSLDFPDLFFCHTANAAALGREQLLDWHSCFSEEELADFVPAFVEEGMIGEQLAVLPVSKSTHLLFLNGAQFERFSAETGTAAEELATWEGFFDTADRFRLWSGGTPFCAMDFLLRAMELYAASAGTPLSITQDGWYDFTDPHLKTYWMAFARPLVEGSILVSDLYSNTQVMTGEVEAGLGSSAAILYYNDTVTYPDNRSEPLELITLPMPMAAGGTPVTTQAGVGLCAASTTPQKAEAAALFAHWFTEKQRNLDFAISAGYVPVKNDAFDEIDGHLFPNDNYQQLYGTLQLVHARFTPLTVPDHAGYFARVDRLYDALRQEQPQWAERFQDGEAAEALMEESWELFRSIS